MYLNTFINLEENINGYSNGSNQVTGHATITMPGRVKLYVDNLRDAAGKDYVCYLMSKSKNKSVRLGELNNPSQSKQNNWKIDLKDVCGKGLDASSATVTQINLMNALYDIEDTILYDYPQTPMEIMEIYNELLRFQYEEKADEEVVEKTVMLMREFYVDEIIQLNPEQTQVDNAWADVELYHSMDNYMIASSITQSQYISNINATFTVQHILTRQIINKEYKFINDNGIWKLYNWSDIIQD
ncbi:MAG: hypothetical protein ATN34_00290 [Epulopiscium sp. Nele67-Bin002]|nr:MAG: hypothetical protein ATN34_00290 [Epulopiscium sp. Nele67-Bin002]